MSESRIDKGEDIIEAKEIRKLTPSSAKDDDLIEMKQRQIVESACPLFTKKGFHRTTIREIAQAAGMSMGQLYHYISSKEDILFLVYRMMEKNWDDHLQDTGIEDIEDPVERLSEVLFETYKMEATAENRELALFSYTETKYLEKQQLHVALERFDKNVIGFWRHLLHEGNRQKAIKCDVDFAASVITYLMFFFALSGWTLRDKPQNEIVNSLTDFVLRGLGLKS